MRRTSRHFNTTVTDSPPSQARGSTEERCSAHAVGIDIMSLAPGVFNAVEYETAAVAPAHEAAADQFDNLSSNEV